MNPPRIYHGPIHRDAAALEAWLASVPAEPALEPDLPIVDPHHHIWENAKRGRYLFHDLLADITASGHDVRQTIFVECAAMYRADGPKALRPLGEIEFVRGVAAMSASGQYGSPRIAHRIVGHADLTLGAAVRDVLEQEVEAAGGLLSGIRICTAWDEHDEIQRHMGHPVPAGHLLNPGLREGAAVLAEMGLTFETWLMFHQLPELIALARAVPQLTIILDHVGGPIGAGPYSGRTDILPGWREDMRTLAACPNVHVKLGGLGMLQFGFDFHLRETPASSAEIAEAWRPYIETSIELFGPERAMFESNFPVDKQSCGYGTLWNAFKRLAAGASREEKAALFHDTATRLYRL